MLYTPTNVTVATAGTAVQVSATRVPASWVNVQALSTNTGAVYVGASTVSNSSGSKWGVRLTAGSSFLFPAMSGVTAYDLWQFWINADTSGDKVSLSYFVR